MIETSKSNDDLEKQSSESELSKNQDESAIQDTYLRSEDVEVDLMIESDPNHWEEDLDKRT